MSSVELKVPDIGGHENVDIIAVEIKVGDTVELEQTLITLETDKATMDVPADAAGVVKEVCVKVGDKISEGGVIAVIEASGSAAVASAPKTEDKPAAPAQVETPKSAVPAPQAASFSGSADAEYDVVVLGGGPGGYSAAFAVADEGLKVAIVEQYSTLGGVCLNVGCIPSKALLHNAAVIDEVKHLAANGIKYTAPEIDIDMLRGYKEKVIGKLTGGLAGMAKARKVDLIKGFGKFVGANHIEVALTESTQYEQATETGSKKTVAFKNCIIAVGSRVVNLPFIPKDPRIVDSTGALELRQIPEKMLIIGGGIIGLEMGTVYSTLGARLDVVEMMDGLMQGADRDLVKVWEKMNAHRFDNIMTKTKTVAVEAKEDGIYVTFEGEKAPAEPQRYDLVLVAAGRVPNGKLCDAEKAGVAVTELGFIEVDKQQRTNVPHIYAIGDVVGQPMLAHKAVHEGHVAAENCAGHKAFFDARVIPGVAYTDPEVAWVGVTEEIAKRDGIKITKSVFPWAASGRAIANGRDEGFTKLIFDAETGHIIGGGIVGTHAGDMIGEICLAIEMGCDAEDIGKTIHPHPTLGESIGMAAEVANGTCTDLPPQKKAKK
ncbi:dihydrolipoyl dehydrogenase [Simonsiella muelleri]|uniref:Dihydrolipoyl dehydrogenase n=1 Tax=Simonsiella muelleri ATCC 29453 TaxID=641147 RepID=V9HLI9_9NEIS|nr:dihydrolipoyl dehydrogenase [Simonsiella muelleri]AUX61388.1 dihydrolipoyl dehydrogenase [Simonsiella muelleri ATCC 29453]EFG31096.1 dihydrolipoyl dehydrogenase [Simonsiella muelleri ATCC 29453]UBQ53440.1 dihydrolipoyl dehydrogenase [Simonsiella muelleri]